MAIYDGFYDARTARASAVGANTTDSDVLTEINVLQIAVNTAVIAGSLRVEVDAASTSPMTTSDLYYNALTDLDNPDNAIADTYKVARVKMDKVINYFSRLGYTISRNLDAGTTRMAWEIKW